jgi:hypothetical protein
MEAEKKIEAWNAAWMLVGGLVVCTDCICGQSLLDAALPFEHAPSCHAYGDIHERPWFLLHGILDKAL